MLKENSDNFEVKKAYRFDSTIFKTIHFYNSNEVGKKIVPRRRCLDKDNCEKTLIENHATDVIGFFVKISSIGIIGPMILTGNLSK